MRLFRHDAISPDVYEATDSDLRRQTFLWCLFSCAAGEDLRPYFRDWGFEVDNAYFDRLMPVIKRAVRDLPEPDVEGWSYCPGNKRFYRLTPWPMTFWEAEAAARTYGGHLAAVRNAAEAEWLAGRFAGRGALWIGITDDGTEGTLATPGRKHQPVCLLEQRGTQRRNPRECRDHPLSGPRERGGST